MITCLILAFTAIHVIPPTWATMLLPLFFGMGIAITGFIGYKALRGQLPATPLDLPLLLLVLVALISSWRTWHDSQVRVLTLGAYVAAYYFIYLYVSEAKLTESIIRSGWVIMVIFLAIGLYHLYQPLPRYDMGNDNVIASILLLHLPYGARIRNRRTQTVWFILGAMTMLSTRSRGGLLGLAWTMATLWRFDRRLLALATVAALPILFYWKPGTALVRLCYWGTAWQAFLSRPLLGIGPANCLQWITPRCGQCPHAHNIFLTVAAEMGVVGLAIFCLLIWQIWKHRRPGPAWAALVGFMVHSLVDDPIWLWSPGLGVMSLLAIMTRQGGNNDNKNLTVWTDDTRPVRHANASQDSRCLPTLPQKVRSLAQDGMGQ